VWLIVIGVVVIVVGGMLLGRGGGNFVSFDAGVTGLVSDGDPLGDFQVAEHWDDFEQRERPYAISLAAADGRELGLGWVCLDDGLNVVLYLGGYFEGDEERDIEVRYRFDDGRPSDTEYWRLFSDNEAAFLWRDAVEQFTDAALAADSVTIRTTDPFDRETITAAFGLEALDEVLDRLGDCDKEMHDEQPVPNRE
jgi:hypothetical protein